MTGQGNNLRVRRTQKLLREALIELIEEHGFDSLTVGQITERAMVSRAAFYRNYQDKYALVEQIFEEAMQTLLHEISEPEMVHSPQIWVKFFEHIGAYERLYGALLGRKGSSWFVLKMRSSLMDLIKTFERLAPQWQHNGGQPFSLYPTSDDLIPDLLAAMLVEAITWWLEHNRPYSPEEIARHCVLLAGAIFKETSTW